MKVASALLSKMDDWLNPLSVREFRQAVRSRWVMIVVVLLLLINVVCIGGYLVLEPTAATTRNGGANVYGILFSVLMFVTIGFVPCYAGIRLLLEHNDLNTDLLFGTTLSPSAIVRGKYFSAMALTLLLMSACTPFMTMTYLLRGIDLMGIFLSLGLLLAISALANAIGILVGSIPGSWFIRALVGALALAGLCGLMVFTSTLAFEMFARGGSFGNGTWTPWLVIGSMLSLEAMAIGLLLSYSVVFLSPRTSNRMFPLRLYITAVWLLTGALAIGSTYMMAKWWTTSGRMNSELIFVWGFAWTCAILVLMIASLGERDSWTFRVRRTIPRSGILRSLAFLTYSGSAGGFLWSCLLTLITFFVMASWIDWTSSNPYFMDAEFFIDMAVFAGFVFCYCLMAVVLRMTILRNAKTVILPLVALLIGLSVAVVPYMVVFFMNNNMRDPSPLTLIASPLGLTIPNMRDEVITWSVPLLYAWAPIALLLSLPWFFKQWRQFIRYETSRGPVLETARLSRQTIADADNAETAPLEMESPTT